MTFTTRLKEEITKNDISPLESLTELAAFVRYSSQIKKNRISLTFENASVARRIYKDIKNNYGVNIKITIRNQKRFRVKQIYILEVTEKVDDILESLNINKDGKRTLPEEYFLSSREEIISYLTGAFLACGSVNDPSASGYHLEFTSPLKKDALYLADLLKEFNIQAKVLKRNNSYMTYIKSAEMISDMIRLLGATNCFFYFEDIRIYRDHKNMVNRLNNCEHANVEKSYASCQEQIDNINYLKENDMLMLLDEKVQTVAEYRLKYPETTLQELADIISMETDYDITKSGINHHFRKIKELVKKAKDKE